VHGGRGVAEFGREGAQFPELDDQECGQVGGFEDAAGVEGGGVVPTAVVAVLVVGSGWPGMRRWVSQNVVQPLSRW
jgi:hypothetical protein